MLYKCLNTDRKATYLQHNNSFEQANGPGLDQCNVESLAAFRHAITPKPDDHKNPYYQDGWCIQPGDYLAMYFRDLKANEQKFKLVRNLDYRKITPEQVPQLHPLGLAEVFGFKSAMFGWLTDFKDPFHDLIAAKIMQGIPVELCLFDIHGDLAQGRGHYILANQYDSTKDLISFKDPAPEVVTWKRETTDTDLNKWLAVGDMTNIQPFFVTLERLPG